MGKPAITRAFLQFSHLLLFVICQIFCYGSFQIRAAIAAAPQEFPERSLVFPERVGKLFIQTPKEIGSLNQRNDKDEKITVKAEGTVRVPQGRIVVLRPDFAHAENTSIFKRFKPGDFQGLSLAELPITGAGLKNFAHITGIQWIEADNTELDDDAFFQMTRLTKLKRLRISRTLISDKGVAYLRQIRSLKRLNISKNDLSDSALKIIAEMTQLEDLDLSRLRLTNKGIAYIARMPNLERLQFNSNQLLDDRSSIYFTTMPKLSILNLSGTQITMKSLPNFKKMKKLVELKVNQNLFTRTEMMKLRNELPGVAIEGGAKKSKLDLELFEPLH